MCGINGFVSKQVFALETANTLLNTMNNQIIHRGPDDDGCFVDADKLFQLGMAMRRLSIIDLATGSQPIFNEDKSIVIVFNGEIYNYKELKDGLIQKGVLFQTQSDTEVILKLYERLGTKAFSMLDGAFGFSIYDKQLKKVYIVRDFFGEKPVYYSGQNGIFYWASELKSIISILPAKPPINISALNLYFQLTYIPSPYTIYQNIHKLEVNHYIEFDCTDFKYEIKEIELAVDPVLKPASFNEAKKLTFEYVMKSVKSRSIADVPLGVFLSGGVDSSIVSWCLAQQSDAKIDTFSIGFEKKSFDETDKSKAVAKLIGSNHHEFIISESDLAQKLHEIILNFDEPFADSSALPSYLVASNTSKFVKVALTGDGADEIFGGYNKYLMGKLNHYYTRVVPEKFHHYLLSSLVRLTNIKEDNRGLRFKINRLLKSINYKGDFYYNIISLGFQNNELSELFSPGTADLKAMDYYKNSIGPSQNSLTQFRKIDRIVSLEGDMCVKVDRTSMYASIECRSPYLNKQLWNFTNQLPEDYLIKIWNKKYLLKEAFKDQFPKGFLDKKKKGFGVPVGDWLKKSLKEELLGYIDYQFIAKQNIFRYEFIQKIVNDHINGKVDNTFRVWTFYCFQKWYQNSYGK